MSKRSTLFEGEVGPVRTTVSVPAPQYAELERIAEQKKVSVAWVIRHAIDEFLAAASQEASSSLLRTRK